MKTSAPFYGLLVLLLAGIGITWLYSDVYTLEAIVAWVQHLTSRKPFTLTALYGLAPTLQLWGTAPPMAEEALCRTTLSIVFFFMGTTMGVMVACLTARYLASVWRASRLFGVLAAFAFPGESGKMLAQGA